MSERTNSFPATVRMSNCVTNESNKTYVRPSAANELKEGMYVELRPESLDIMHESMYGSEGAGEEVGGALRYIEVEFD